jgi:hypothetical protein
VVSPVSSPGVGGRAVGIEYEPHWVEVSRANLDLARDAGIEHDGRTLVTTGYWPGSPASSPGWLKKSEDRCAD